MGCLALRGSILRIKPLRRPVEDLGLLSVPFDPFHLPGPELAVSDHVVQGENIDEYALVERHIFFHLAEQDARSVTVSELCMPSEIPLIGVKSLQEIGLLKLVGVGAQNVILVSEHHQIDVVVPGNHSFVSLGTEDGSAGSIVLDPVLLTDLIKLIKKIQLHSPDLFHMGRDQVSASLFFLIKRIFYLQFHISPLF